MIDTKAGKLGSSLAGKLGGWEEKGRGAERLESWAATGRSRLPASGLIHAYDVCLDILKQNGVC